MMVNSQLHDPVAATSRKVPNTLWIEYWLVSRANLDAVKVRKISTAAATICSEPVQDAVLSIQLLSIITFHFLPQEWVHSY